MSEIFNFSTVETVPPDGSDELLTVPPGVVGRIVEPFPLDGSDDLLNRSPLMGRTMG